MALIHPATLAEVAAFAVPALGSFARRGFASNRRGIGDAAGAFNGNFNSIFPAAYQSVQTDIGLTYGGTMLAAGTAPPVLTLTGSVAGVAVPIRVEATSSGALGVWQGKVSYDGGSSFPQTFTSAATIPLTAGATGLTLNIAAGNATGPADNFWLATCSALADQSGNAAHYSQATPANQAVITPGLNGCPGLLLDGTNDDFGSTLSQPAPGTQKWCVFGVFKHITWNTNDVPFASRNTADGLTSSGVTPQMVFFNGSSIPANNGATLGSWVEFEVELQNTAADRLKLGTVTTTGIAGNAVLLNPRIGSLGGSRFSNMEFLALVYVPGTPNFAAARAAVTAKYGVSVIV